MMLAKKYLAKLAAEETEDQPVDKSDDDDDARFDTIAYKLKRVGF